jgi:hypothetical protein
MLQVVGFKTVEVECGCNGEKKFRKENKLINGLRRNQTVYRIL